MSDSGYYPIGAENDEHAPYNKEDKVAIKCPHCSNDDLETIQIRCRVELKGKSVKLWVILYSYLDVIGEDELYDADELYCSKCNNFF